MNEIQILEREHKLNPRQWALFRLFKTEGRLLHNKEIQQLMPKYYSLDNDTKKTAWNNSWVRRLITEDTKALEMSLEIDDVVIADIVMGSGIPTQKEYEQWAIRERSLLTDRETKKRIIDKKASLNGQYNLQFAYEKPIREAFREVNN
jgi:hypothetical protein